MEQPTAADQAAFWNDWIQRTRGSGVDGPSERRRTEVLRLMRSLGSKHLKILEVGCANGWLAANLREFGPVTGTDIADAAIREAQANYPDMKFVAGDFYQLHFDRDFDVVVCVDSLASVADHPRFMRHMADHLRTGGHLILTSQNPFVFSRYSRVSPLAPGQVRNWASRSELRDLLERHFDVLEMRTVNATIGDRGVLGVVNSRWVNFPAKVALLGQRNVDRVKEALGFGQTIVTLARKH
jgi:2-polyprenyl-3-methyl-5-hydroxy-6-metoxy-1,4-benzoquinol methylase